MHDDNEQNDYEVGYKKPPRSSQFKEGSSGNPRGRAKSPLNFDDQLMKEFGSFMTINENGRPVRVSKREVMIKQTLNQAIKGNPQAIRLSIDIFLQALAREAQRNPPDTGFLKLDDGSFITDEQLKADGLVNLTTRDLGAVEGMSIIQVVNYLRKRQ